MDDDDIRLEEEIEIELSRISISSLEADDPDTELSAEASSDSEPISDDLPESVLHYLNFVRNRSQNAERLLQDLENDDMLSDIYSVVPNSTSNCLAELASEYNEDPDELKKRVLSEIEDEELQISTEIENAVELSNDGSILSNEIVDSCSLIDGSDMAISFTFQEVEARCKQEYELRLEKQKEVDDDKMKKLKEEREMEEMEKKIEINKRQRRQEELEAERMKLEMLHVQHQTILDDALKKEEEVWEEKLIQHKKLIQNLHMQIEKELMAFEEQKAKEKQQMLERQNKAAQKIQASFRAFRVYRSYAPVLKAWRAELKKQKDQQETIEREQREKEERMRRRALEKKQEERKSREEKEREELAEREKRHEEYENKKEFVRIQRREKVMLLEHAKRERCSLKCLTEWEVEPENTAKAIKMVQEEQEIEKVKEDSEAEEMPRRTGTENTDQNMALAQKEKEIEEEEETLKAETGMAATNTGTENTGQNMKLVQKEKEIEEEEKTLKMETGVAATNKGEDLEIAKKKGKIEKANKQEKDTAEKLKQFYKTNFAKATDFPTQEIKLKEEKPDTKICLWHDNSEEKQTSGKTEFLNERNNNNIVENGMLYAEDCGSATADYQKSSDTRTLDIKTVVPAEIVEVVQESGARSTHISMNVQLGSGNTGQTEKSYASENISRELAKKEVQSEVDDLWVKGEISVEPFEKSNLLSDSVEEKRLMWMKTCKSWSRIYSEHKKKKVIERSKPRKCSASSMPPLSTAMIIQDGRWNTLEQVTTVTFQDLPGCSLSTLSQCARLQFLSLRRCGLIALEGLSNCKDLKYIDVEENNIQTINCDNLENLCILILNKNRISSIHGLYGCSNLWNLEFSYNKITRIGGLESLKNLQRLVVNHNQLISTKGLSDSPTLIYIDCSFNHLTHIEGIENCGLLQILKLQGNNLSEFPSLENHVLLRELYLEDNSISAFEKFSNCWLPLLQTLSFSQNSLTHLAPLFSYLSLEKLDVSNNCLLHLKSVVQCLTGCHNLRELSLGGNPLLQEEAWRNSLLKMLPSLKILNGENISSIADVSGEVMKKKPDPGSFIALCQTQIKEINSVSKKATKLTGEFSVDAVQRQCWYFKKLMKLSSEHRYAHEFGVVNASEGEEPEKLTNNLNQETINITEEKNFFITGAKENKQNLLNTPERSIASGNTQPMSVNSFTTVFGIGSNQECRQEKNCIPYSLNHSEESKDNMALISPKRDKFSKQIVASNGGNYLQHFDSSQNLAATIIQSYWRGYKVRKEIDFYMRLHMAATVIQSFWRSYCIRKKIVSCKTGHHFMDKHKAATVLQALWRGFHLRKKLASALAAVKTDELEDDYQEVNMDDFMFDDAVIQKEWPTLDSTRFLSQTLLFTDQLPSPKKYNEPVQQEDKSDHLMWPAQKTWQFRERPNSFLSENSQISTRSEKNTVSQFSNLKPSPKSLLKPEKEEQISAEWGFKDLATAQLMLKRAHKMKAKKSSSKKLDPAVRLALFKNNENKHPPVKPPKKAQTGKMSYFEGVEEDFTHTDKSVEKMERNKERTYQWLHTQVWDYEGPNSRNEKCKHFLPEIDPEILKGGRVQLVTSPVRRVDTDLELVSVTSGSTLTQNREKNNQPHRHSTGFPKKDAPAPERSQLGPSRKERISFRDHPVQLSGGWGSGKKKAKPLK
ncbi:leucine-rich repeat and IQ domain-containing protein 1 [Eublepharis macularius]|uniref:Leucine-rich repeat and IQ domain-containing protein 1 n=1 Tax=Eublepharis macularius TaxID=481883 RepID=A0AA97LAH1_EUBMA|nr:leucine-rich repeat and IQ domain-containing protein 1 [Eublepharis macularius]